MKMWFDIIKFRNIFEKLNFIMNKFSKFSISLALVSALAIPSFSQSSKNWFNEDPAKDRFAGVSSDLSYEELVKDKKAEPVIVAVIDGGTEVTHPDLQENIWVNPDEIKGNGIDDDHNGYVDDINGWNFIGGQSGDVGFDTFEATRIYNKYKPLYEGKSTSGLTAEQKEQYKQFQEAKTKIDKELTEAKSELAGYTKLKSQLDELKTAMGTDDFKAEDVAKYKSSDEEFNKLKSGVASAMAGGTSFDEIYNEIDEAYKYYYGMVHFQYNTDYDPRKIVGDHYEDYSERNYGNS